MSDAAFVTGRLHIKERIMKIGLLDIDCHAAKKKWGATVYPNLALCKIAAWHKQHGDTVEWATPFEHYDILYRSKIFNFTPDDHTIYNCDKEVRGGTGYDIYSALPDEIDAIRPDFSIYPNVDKDTSFGFLTRGCIRKCKWCVVPLKEGAIRPYWDVDRVANGRKRIVLMDNNILAAGDYAKEQFEKIIERGYRVDFNQAMDARLVTDEFAQLLARMKWIDNRIRFGCDTTAQIKDCEIAMNRINRYGFKGEYFLYTMIGGQNDLHECYKRLNYWWTRLQCFREYGDGRAVYAYAQPYRDPINPNHEIPQWQKDMAQWCNKRMIFCTTDFMDFSPRKGFTCKEYFD